MLIAVMNGFVTYIYIYIYNGYLDAVSDIVLVPLNC